MSLRQLNNSPLKGILTNLPTPSNILLFYHGAHELDKIQSEQKGENWSLIITDNSLRIKEKQQVEKGKRSQKIVWACKIEDLIELCESDFTEIITNHDYVFFTDLQWGLELLNESIKEALVSSLGSTATYVITSYIEHQDPKCRNPALNLGMFLDISESILGSGAEYLNLAIAKKLYCHLRSSQELIRVDE